MNFRDLSNLAAKSLKAATKKGVKEVGRELPQRVPPPRFDAARRGLLPVSDSAIQQTLTPEKIDRSLPQETRCLSAYQQDIMDSACSWFLSRHGTRDFSTSSGSDVLHPNGEQYKKFDQFKQNVEEKIQYLPAIFHDKMKETLALLSEKFRTSSISVVSDDTQKLSFAQKDETTINDITKSISEINKDLDQWHHVQEVPKKLEGILVSVPKNSVLEKYRLLACNLVDRDMQLVREAYRLILATNKQRADLPNPRNCFETVCGLLEKRLEMLKDVCSQQTDGVGEDTRLIDKNFRNVIKKYSEVKDVLQTERLPSGHESFDNLMKKWKEHARSHELLLACFGGKDSYIHMKELSENFKEYMKSMDSCTDEISHSLEKRDLNTTEKLMNNFINTTKAFDKYLKDHGWLGNTLIERFQRTFKTEIVQNSWYKGRFRIKSEDEIRRGTFSNEIDVNEGVIRGLVNFKYDTGDWYLSDVVYAHIQLALKEAKISQFTPTRWSVDNVANVETAPTAAGFVRSMETAHTFQAGSKEFAAIAQTTAAKSRFYLLKDHFPHREVKSITVRYSYEGLYIEYEIGARLLEGEKKMTEQEDKHRRES